MRRSYIVAALALAALAGLWHFWLGTPWTIRVSRDAISSTKYFGTQTNADARTGLMPEQDVLSSYDKTIRVMDASDWPRSVLLEDSYTARDIKTGAINFEHVTTARVDPRTGAWFEGPHKGDIVFFPRNVEKRTYTMRSNYVSGIPLKFAGERVIGGVDVYLFSYRGPIDLTAAYAGTAEYPGFPVPAGHAIRCSDDQFYYRTWIEPRTGGQVRVEEGCLSGDFVYDKVTGAKLAAVDRWNGVTSGSDLDIGITAAYNERHKYLGALYLPGILLLGSLGALTAGRLRREGIAVS